MGINELRDGLVEVFELDDLGENLWSPVTEPPSKGDGNEAGDVLVFQRGEGTLLMLCHWSKVSREVCGHHSLWAPIREVVLLPLETF